MLTKVVLGFTFILLATNLLSFGQSPSLKCLVVDGSGNVQLTWVPPSDSCGVFNQYYIYSALSQAGPYTLIDSVSNFATTTYIHTGAGAGSNSVWYYIEASSGCVLVPTDTLQTIFLTVTNTGNGIADLQWNDMHNPLVSTATGMYLINRQDSATGTWQNIDSVFQLLQYLDPFTACPDSARYTISLFDSSGCQNVSNVVALPPDISSPPAVVIDSASIDPITGQIVIGWQASSAADVIGYVITVYNIANQGYDDIDTVYGATSYVDLLGNLNLTDSMFIYALDGCGNVSAPVNGHSTIKLLGIRDTCRGVITLDWTPYYLWSTGVSTYDVYVSVNGGAYFLDISGNMVSATQYDYAGLDRAFTYCFFVRANDGLGNKTSSSNIICAYIDTSGEDLEPFTLTVEARDSVKNHLFWSQDASWSSNLISGYNIYRNMDEGAYSLIDFVPFGTNSYKDLLEPLGDYIIGEGYFCYIVVPLKQSASLYGCINSSESVCVTQFPKFVVANTFTPNGDGRNDVFLPIKAFVKSGNYLLMIFTRWGQLIFETTDITEGWDGLFHGFPVQHDAYVYYVTFVIKDDIKITRAGTVLLLR